MVHPPLHEMSLQELISYMPPSIAETANRHESDDDIKVTLDKEQFLSDHYIAHVTPPAYTPSLPLLTTMEPADTLLMGDEVINITPAKETDKFIKFSVNDLVPIPRESEVTSDSNLECDMPVNTPLPYTDVLGDAIVDIDLPFGEHLDTLSTRDREIDFNSIRDIEELERLLADDPVPVSVPRVFDEPLGNSDSMSRSSETSDLLFEELIAEIGLDESIPSGIDDRILFDREDHRACF
ncbi:hypothetical protein Tco_0820240 [Tanacetum coccineum]|uniref:Uncharacterized protein n=1 Tax=Tanacetum coccineum TaxID=301880 RepID=A0ABQ5AD65_9ASTR